MLGYIVARSNNGVNITVAAPAGWTTIQYSGAASVVNVASFYKVADSADAAASNFVFTGFPNSASDDHGFAAIARITGANPINPLDGVNIGSVSATTSMSSGGINPSFTDLFIEIAAHVGASNGATVSASNYAVANNNPSWTQQSTQSAGTSDANNLGQSMASANASASGDTGNATATAGGATGTHYLQIIAIKTTETITVSPVTDSVASAGIAPGIRRTLVLSTPHSIVSAGIAPVVTVAEAAWRFAQKTASTVWNFRNKP